MNQEIIELQKNFFSEKEKLLLKKGPLEVSLFRYTSGVCAIRVRNQNGEFVVLPYQGQQIWRMGFLGHDLTMKSEFEEPVITKDFHTNYGMFLLHCGLTAMGNPTAQDIHPQHGELPFAPYDKAYLVSGSDEKGDYVGVGGSYHHARAFRVSYIFEPLYKLYDNGSTIHLEVCFTNCRGESLEYFYLCHINYLPVDGSRLVYSARRQDIRHHYAPGARLTAEKKAAYDDFFNKLCETPEIQDTVDRRSQFYEPEICSTVTYQHDEEKNAYCMQILPDGYSCYVRFDPTALPIGLRWIARTCGEDAMGMVLPATAEHLGYSYCKAHHFERCLAPGQSVRYQIEMGILSPGDTADTEEKIRRILEAAKN